MRDDGRFCSNCGYVLPQQTQDDSALSSTPTSSTHESFTALAQIQLLSEPAPYDVRYPRPLWFRVVRWLAICVNGFVGAIYGWVRYEWWHLPVLAFISYLVDTIINFFFAHIISFTNIYLSISFSSKVIQYLPFNQLFSLAWWGYYWWVVLLVPIGALIAFYATTIFGYFAEEDHEREQKELNKRQRPSNSLYDMRYPRPLWFRIVRRLARLVGGFVSAVFSWVTEIGEWWRIPVLSLITYLVCTIISFFLNGIISFTQIKFDILFSSKVIPALPLNQLFSSNWWVVLLIVVGALVAFAAIAKIGKVADVDHKREQNELNEKQRPAGFTLRYALCKLPTEIPISQIAWSPDGTILASYARSGSAFSLWNPATGKLLRTIDIDGYGNTIAWSPDGKILAVGSYSSVSFWNTQTGKEDKSFGVSRVDSVVWSPDGQTLAFTAHNSDIKFFDIKTKQIVSLSNSRRSRQTIAWSPDGKVLASVSDPDIQIWDAKTSQLLRILSYPNMSSRDLSIYASIAWSPDGQILASSDFSTILLWDPHTGRQIGSFEGSSTILSLSFSADSRLLVARNNVDHDNIKLWRTDTWEMVAALNESSSRDRNEFGTFFSVYANAVRVAFHPTETNVLATLGAADTIIRVWDLDLATLLEDVVGASPAALTSPSARPQTPVERITGKLPKIPSAPTKSEQPVASSEMARYRNAKVVLVGDSGVGKSGLGLVLSGQPFAPTVSTHGRLVWTFANTKAMLARGQLETRETLLWDLAGQAGYRLIHQLHLNEVTVALVIFDAHSETHPFAGVYYWNRALRLAQSVEGTAALPLKKFLVAARIDRSGIRVSRTRLSELMNEQGFDDYFETSAIEGRGIPELQIAIQKAIDWESLPWVISTELFQRIKDFLVAEKEAGRLISTVDDLYRTFLRTAKALEETKELLDQFKICIGRVESRGLIRRLSFGDLVLLQPELIEAYASALFNAVKDEPDGLGSITEERVIAVQFAMPADERLKDKERAQEKILMIAMVEDLLRYEIALREQAEGGPYLVFPSQSTLENPDLPNPAGKAMTFSFDGPVQNIYATLAVRLSSSGLFQKEKLWKNAITYTYNAPRGGICGIFLEHTGEGTGQLTLFFGQEVSAEMRSHFEHYVESHLRRRALPESIKRHRMFVCTACAFVVSEDLVQRRLARGFNWLNCPECDQRVSLLEQDDSLGAAPSETVQRMEQQSDIQRKHERAKSVLKGKIQTKDFDVFLCHHETDKPQVRRINEQLRERGILPWLDELELRPGRPWQRALEEQIGKIKAAAVFIGPSGIDHRHQHELEAFLREFDKRECPVIPVILPDAPQQPDVPIFLQSMKEVDFRTQQPDPIQQLIWGVTGEYAWDTY